MNSAVLKRFIFIAGICLFIAFALWIMLAPGREPGDFHTQMGDTRLSSRHYGEALEYFDQALEEMPNHRGALMGRALVFIHTDRHREAVAELSRLIDFLERTLEDRDLTGRGTLAAAYANRGIVHDRNGRHEQALADYEKALAADPESVKGPRIWDRILYGTPQPSTVAKRAVYLREQFELPEQERVLLIPEEDEKERTYKP